MLKVRKFETGATRDTDTSKYDYEGFLNPLVIERFAQYMHKHRVQSDGSLRDSDNWQKGIPIKAYMKSFFRHSIDLWAIFRGYFIFKIRNGKDEKTIMSESKDAADSKYLAGIEDTLCAIMFNVMGFLFEVIRDKEKYKCEKNFDLDKTEETVYKYEEIE